MTVSGRGPVVVTGANGLLGSALSRMAGIQALDRAQLDICDPDAVAAALDRLQPRALINAAAMARVDEAEGDPARAFAVNARAPGGLARLCAARGVRLVHISTDYALRGPDVPGHLLSEDAAPAPVGVYAQSKVEGEQAVLAQGGVVVRVQWLYAPEGRSFFARALAGLRSGATLRLVPDQLGCPSPAPLIAEWVHRIAEGGPTGLFHLATTGAVSPVGWMQSTADLLGLSLRWTPLPRSEIGPVPRPARSCLDGARARAAFGLPMVDWEQALIATLRTARLVGPSQGQGQGPSTATS
jgi:dTDP-4-dehydrorhamnose reductase